MNTSEFNKIKEVYLNAEKEYYLTKKEIMDMYPQFSHELELIPDVCWYEKTDDGRIKVHANMGFAIQIFDDELSGHSNFRLSAKDSVLNSFEFLQKEIANILTTKENK